MKDSDEDGVLWWKANLGAAKRISAFLYFNRDVGDVFSMEELRVALGEEDAPNRDEQLNRRLRNLREHEWVIDGYKDSSDLSPATYRLVAKGKRLWLGEKVIRDTVSNKVRRQVFERDRDTCQICGVVAGEPYADDARMTARMTVGHRVPNQRLGRATLNNLQAECARCNEPIRNLLPDPETLDNIMPAVSNLSADELRVLDEWLQAGRRTQPNVDVVYARIRRLGDSDRAQLTAHVHALLKGQS